VFRTLPLRAGLHALGSTLGTMVDSIHLNAVTNHTKLNGRPVMIKRRTPFGRGIAYALTFLHAYNDPAVIAELQRQLLAPAGLARLWWKVRTRSPPTCATGKSVLTDSPIQRIHSRLRRRGRCPPVPPPTARGNRACHPRTSQPSGTK
jgi:hypothetical protein